MFSTKQKSTSKQKDAFSKAKKNSTIKQVSKFNM